MFFLKYGFIKSFEYSQQEFRFTHLVYFLNAIIFVYFLSFLLVITISPGIVTSSMFSSNLSFPTAV